MDPDANLVEQHKLALSILATWDACADDGEFTQEQMDSLASDGYRLAELVEAQHEYRNRPKANPPVTGATGKLCSWCHQFNWLVPNQPTWCPKCKHRADTPRMQCTCALCFPKATTQETT